MSGPPRPTLPSRSFTTGSHSPSPPPSSDSLGRQPSLSLSEGSSDSAGVASAARTEPKRQYSATGHERIFPMRNVVHARPSLSRKKTGAASSRAQSPPTSPQGASSARSPKAPPPPSRRGPNIVNTRDRSPLISTPSSGGAFEWFPSSTDATSPSEQGAPMDDIAEFVEPLRPPPLRRTSTRVVTSAGEYWVTKGEVDLEEEAKHQAGAVQPYACLLVLEEDEEGRFVVQQVSENSSVILGVPPLALFQSPTFTTFLTQESTDTFLDAVDALDDNESPSPDGEEDPEPEPSEDRPEAPSKTLPPPEQFTVALSNESVESPRFYASLHRPDPLTCSNRFLLELEPEHDFRFPLTTPCDLSAPAPTDVGAEGAREARGGTERQVDPSEEEILRSTVSLMKPLKAIARRRSKRAPEINMVQLVYQIEEQLRKANSLEVFLSVTTGIFRELTGFDRALVLQFDDDWNARCVAENLDRRRTSDLYLDLTFPASAIASASLSRTGIALVYDSGAPRSPMCARSAHEAANQVDMTRCTVRSPPPERLERLENMNIRSSMTVSLFAFGRLWGTVWCSSSGSYGHRVSVPIRNLCTYLGESLSRTVERLSYERRLQARRVINLSATNDAPAGHIIASGDELLSLFQCEAGCLSVGEEAKILGEVDNATEILAVLEYLRDRCYTSIQMSNDIAEIFPDCRAPTNAGFKQIAGILVIPLSSEGQDFILFTRRGEAQEVRWVGDHSKGGKKGLEIHRQQLPGQARPWSDETLDTAEVLGTIYSRFIAVWREREHYVQANSVTSLLLANASHEVRTPLNAIVNFLELALDASESGGVVSEHLRKTQDASKALQHVIGDLLDLTRAESGEGDLFVSEAFDLRSTIEDAISLQQLEATRRGLKMELIEDPQGTPSILLGDRNKIRLIVGTVVGNAVKYTDSGSITITFGEIPDDEPAVGDQLSPSARKDSIRVGITVEDTGRGIEDEKLEAFFSALHHVKQDGSSEAPIGLGLAVTARIVENLSGQLRVESEVGKGSRFRILLPLGIPIGDSPQSRPTTLTRRGSSSGGSRESLVSKDSKRSEIDNLISAISSAHLDPHRQARRKELLASRSSTAMSRPRSFVIGEDHPTLSQKASRRSLRASPTEDGGRSAEGPRPATSPLSLGAPTLPPLPRPSSNPSALLSPPPLASENKPKPTFKILVVEDEPVNRLLIERRLLKDGHRVTVVHHGGMAVRAVEEDPTFDLILMDLNMPICDGYEASAIIRQSEPNYIFPPGVSRPPSHILNNGIPIIAVTANSHERGREQLVEAGIDGWCLKPVRFPRLAEIMSGALDVEARRRDLHRPGDWEKGGWLSLKRPRRSKSASSASSAHLSHHSASAHS